MIRRFTLFPALLATVALVHAAKPPAATDADASAEKTTYEANGDVILTGHAKIVDTDTLLTADEIRVNQKTQIAVATGHVVLTRVGDRLLADQLTLHRADGTFTAVRLKIGRFPYYIAGASAEGSRERVIIRDAVVTYSEPGVWQPTIHARALDYSPGHYLRLTGANVGIGNYRPVPVSRAGQELGKSGTAYALTLDGGYRHSLGAYGDVVAHLPVFQGVTIGPDIGVYTFRGVLLGPVANYDVGSGDNTATGFLKSGYIHDYGIRDEDILGNLPPTDRGYAEWQHSQQIGENLTVNADVNWMTDSEVLRDFHSKDFVPVQEPDNYVEALYTGADWMTSVFTRFQPDPYYPVQQRVPELRFDLLPFALGGGVYVRFDTSLDRLKEDPPAEGIEMASDRFDTFLGISRPFTYNHIFDLTPVVGGRFTEYWDTTGAAEPGGVGRFLGEVGFDADMKASAVFDYDNPLWHIDGLRHLITPTLGFRYIPNADKDQAWIPEIDRQTFTNYLPIMELGDMRALDQLSSASILRFGLNQTLQTRDDTYGSRDLVQFNLTDDLRFDRAPGQNDFSDGHADLIITPAHWLEFRVEDTVSTEDWQQRAVDADITLREGDLWMARFGLGYLSDNYGEYYVPGLGYNPIIGVDTYHYELRGHLNEVYELFTRGDYDARNHYFVDQYYGVVQRIANTWLLEYAIYISNGPNNGDGHFGFEVSLNILRY